MQKVRPCLWMDNNVQEAITYYTSIFKNSSVGSIGYYPDDAPGFGGAILVAEIKLEDQELMLLNGGPMFKFTEAVSLCIDCKDQEEIDYYWECLTANGGEESRCGWLKDKFGLSWQVSPNKLPKLLSSTDKEKAKRVMDAMMQMGKIILKDLETAAKEK